MIVGYVAVAGSDRTGSGACSPSVGPADSEQARDRWISPLRHRRRGTNWHCSSGHQPCAICGGVLNEEDKTFGTWGLSRAPGPLHVLRREHALVLLRQLAPAQKEFTRAYFDSSVEQESTNQFWAKAYLDDRVLMTVNPFNEESGEADLVLARTGYIVRVDLAEWEHWFDAPYTSEGETLPAPVVEELLEGSSLPSGRPCRPSPT